LGCKNRTLAVDFDGCCIEDTFPEPGPDIPWAVPVLRELVRRGWKLILWTCRINHGEGELAYLDHALEWFKKNDLPLIGVCKLPDELRPYPGITRAPSPKLWAQYYIDDAIPGGFQGWLNIFKLITGEDFQCESG
jgi:hypothetical protein